MTVKRSINGTKLSIRRVSIKKIITQLITTKVHHYGTQLIVNLYHGYENGYKVFLEVRL